MTDTSGASLNRRYEGSPGFYVVGGTVPPDSPSYIERKADLDLFEYIMRGDFCYVLTARQMGKSSLMARSSKRLRDLGVATAVVDLTLIGAASDNIAPAQWYYGFSHALLRDLGLRIDLDEWWRAQSTLPPLQRLTELFLEVILKKIAGRIVVFVDEIDTTIGLPFADDFFAAVRGIYNARALEPGYERLSFVLLGVATPSQLIKDTRRTPFNIGRRIELADFTQQEAQILLAGFGLPRAESERVLERLLYWTAGHPYLTQKICRAIADEHIAEGVCTADIVDTVVEKCFFGPQSVRSEDNLKFVASRLLYDSASASLLRLLTRIRHSAKVFDDATSPLHSALKLSGVVALLPDGRLAVRNRIYERVFSAKWAKTDKVFARMWTQRALRSALTGDRDAALMSRLRAASFDDVELQLREAAHLAGHDYPALAATLRHDGPITMACYSPDGETILTGSEDHTARLWESGSGAIREPPMRHRGPVWSVAFSSNGAKVATASGDHTARIWDAASAEPIGPPLRHRKPVWFVTFSPDSHLVITCSEDRTARLWHSNSGKPTGIVLAHENSVEAAAFSPDGCRIATADAGGAVQLWDAATGAHLCPSIRHDGHVGIVAFSRDGERVLTAGEDKSARIWSARTGEPILGPFRHYGWIRAAMFSPDGEKIVTGSEDRVVRVWDVRPGEGLCLELHHEHWVRTLAVSNDGRVIATGGEDGRVCLWDARSGLLLGGPVCHSGRIVATAFSPDGSTLLTASFDNTVRLWRTTIVESTHLNTFRHDTVVSSVAISPDGQTLVIGGQAHDCDIEDCAARLWNIQTGEAMAPAMTHKGSIRVIAYAQDSSLLLTGSDDKTAVLWNAKTRTVLPFELRHDASLQAAAIQVDQQMAATGSSGAAGYLWNLVTGERIGPPLRHGGAVLAVLFSPNGKLLLTGSSDNHARLWSIETGTLASPLFFHQGSVGAIAFSPDGETVLTGSNDYTARLWSTRTGAPISSPLNHNEAVAAVAFSPDGKLILTGSQDHTVRMWSADSGAPVGHPLRHSEPVLMVAFSSNGKIFFCATRSWIHWYRIDRRPIASRQLPGIWAGAVYQENPDGNSLRIASRLTPDTINLAVISMAPHAEPLEGELGLLLENWGTRLGLEIDDRERIVIRSRSRRVKAPNV